MTDVNRGEGMTALAGEGPPTLDGEFLVDESSRGAAADDFGHIVQRSPAAVLRPGSVDDVVATIRWANRHGHKVAVHGQQHSVYGRAQVADGIVIDMSQRDAVHTVAADGVVVDAGATWRQVLAATLPRRLTPPVLANYLDLSVGGTLVVGGVGDTTSQYGLQSDNALELEVVTGEGRLVSCSPRSNADLFDAVRAGLGQAGIITRATLKLVPAPAGVRRYVLTYPDLRGLLDDQRLVVADDRFDGLQGAVVPTPAGWKFQLDAVAHLSDDEQPDDDAALAGLSDERSSAVVTDLPYLEYLDRLAQLEQALRANGQWFHPHPWLTTFVGDSNVEAMVADELARLTPADLGTFGQVVLSAFRAHAVASPLVQLPDDELVYAFNLIRFPTTGDSVAARRLVEANRAIYERVRTSGGTLYPVSAVPMSGDDWQRHFDSAWTRLRDAKARFDPRGILTPGYEVF